MSAAAALQRGVVAVLKVDAHLLGLLGGPKVFDHLPERVAFPYVSLGECVGSDWSTGTERGDEHLFTVHVWAQRSREPVHAIAARVQRALEAGLAMPGHRLVNLALQRSEMRREPGTEIFHARLRFRAVSEPLD